MFILLRSSIDFLNEPATPEIYTLAPHAAHPIYGAHMGVVPPSGAGGLTALTTAVTNGQGQVAGPVLASVPLHPTGSWAYVSESNFATGEFTLSDAIVGTPLPLPEHPFARVLSYA